MNFTKRSVKNIYSHMSTNYEFQTIDDPPETDKVGVTEEVELTLAQKVQNSCQELSQELEAIKLKLKDMEQPSVQFMAYNPSGATSGSSSDAIANGTTGQSKLIMQFANSKPMFMCFRGLIIFINCIHSVS